MFFRPDYVHIEDSHSGFKKFLNAKFEYILILPFCDKRITTKRKGILNK